MSTTTLPTPPSVTAFAAVELIQSAAKAAFHGGWASYTDVRERTLAAREAAFGKARELGVDLVSYSLPEMETLHPVQAALRIGSGWLLAELGALHLKVTI